MRLTSHEATSLVDTVQTWRYGVDARQHGFFLAKKVRAPPRQLSKELGESAENPNERQEETHAPTTPGTPGQTLGYMWAVSSLSSYEGGFFSDTEPEDRYVCFTDPSNYSQNPGWMLRNLLVLVRHRWKISKVQILCYRDVQSRRDEANSIILNLSTEELASEVVTEAPGPSSKPSEMPKVTGWERNRSGKVASKTANLAEYMDPQR